jgi:hypothetical protein
MESLQLPVTNAPVPTATNAKKVALGMDLTCLLVTNASYLPAYSEAQLPYVLIALPQTAERIGAVVLLDKIVLHTCFRSGA